MNVVKVTSGEVRIDLEMRRGLEEDRGGGTSHLHCNLTLFFISTEIFIIIDLSS